MGGAPASPLATPAPRVRAASAHATPPVHSSTADGTAVWRDRGLVDTLPGELTLSDGYHVLRRLVLSHNALRSLDGLPLTLEHLDVSYNELEDLGGSLAYLRRLQTLDVSHNALADLEPESLRYATALESLNASHNYLRAVDGLGHLSDLETLDISHCLVGHSRALRPLSVNTSLRRLSLRGCPVEGERGLRFTLKNMVPSLRYLDGEPVRVRAVRTRAHERATSASPRRGTPVTPRRARALTPSGRRSRDPRARVDMAADLAHLEADIAASERALAQRQQAVKDDLSREQAHLARMTQILDGAPGEAAVRRGSPRRAMTGAVRRELEALAFVVDEVSFSVRLACAALARLAGDAGAGAVTGEGVVAAMATLEVLLEGTDHFDRAIEVPVALAEVWPKAEEASGRLRQVKVAHTRLDATRALLWRLWRLARRREWGALAVAAGRVESKDLMATGSGCGDVDPRFAATEEGEALCAHEEAVRRLLLEMSPAGVE